MRNFLLLLIIGILLSSQACKEKNGPGEECENCPDDDVIMGAYDPQPYQLQTPQWLGTAIIPPDNPLTEEGVSLGRMLFYDPILSSDSTMSCASCHAPEHSFTDALAVSRGVLGLEGTRSSMSLVNLAYSPAPFFWDGRAAGLEEQALIPVEDHVELNEDWDQVVAKMKRSETYPGLFRAAFGIERKKEITKELVVKAIAQFERTLISYNSRFDQVVWENQGWFTDSEERGRKLFFFEEVPQAVEHPGCSHCHNGVHFTDFSFRNNGLDDVEALTDFPDKGRGAVNGNIYDNGKFRVPSLRNIALTAPYMHDGRFATLEEVIDHYSAGGHGVENEDANIKPFTLTAQDKQDLIAFLHTLTDTTFVGNPAFSNPF